jgi:hypothetical protein
MNCSLGEALRSRYVPEGALCRTHPASSTEQVKTDFKGYVADLALPGMTTSTTVRLRPTKISNISFAVPSYRKIGLRIFGDMGFERRQLCSETSLGEVH